MRTSSVITAIVGLLTLVGAAVLAFVIVPAQAVFPDDVDTTRSYDGMIERMLDAEALAAGDLGNVFVTDVPVTVTRHVATMSVEDGTAAVEDDAVVTGPDGTRLLSTDAAHRIDRDTFMAVPGEELDNAAQEGLVVSFPIGSEAGDYETWNSDLEEAVTATFEGEEEEHAGLSTHVYRTSVTNEPIVSEAVLERFPDALPKSLVLEIGPALGVPDALLQQFRAAEAGLPDQLPLGYVYSGEATFWVEPTSGVVVDTRRSETRSVLIDLPSIPAIPVADVFAWEYSQSDESIAEAVADAEEAAGDLRLYGTTLPLGLAALGVVLLGVAAWTGRRTGDAVSRDAAPSSGPRDADAATTARQGDEPRMPSGTGSGSDR